MSRFINSRYAGLEAYTPGEQPKDMKYIKLNTNESPFPPSVGVLKAVEENAEFLKREIEPDGFDDHEAHILEHTRFLLSVDVRRKGDNAVKNRVVEHIEKHKKMKNEEVEQYGN